MQPHGAQVAPKFSIGAVSLTSGAARLPPAEIADAVGRHARGEWGDVDGETARANERALAEGGPLVSAFYSVYGVRFLATTDGGGDGGPVTTLALESESRAAGC